MVLSCECLLAFCDDCARKQIFQTMKEKVIGISDVAVYCPKCKTFPILDDHKQGNNLLKESVVKAEAAVKEWVRFVPLS